MKYPNILAVALLTSLGALPAQAAERTGKEVVDGVCAACHAKGENGAPRLNDRAEWSRRASKGLGQLTANAISGVRNMPAHGGQAQLSDIEMSRAVAYMVSGGNAADPGKAYAAPQRRTGEQIVVERCQTCHADGKNGSPRLGVMAEWQERLKKGTPALVKSAINGHNSMPARGGMDNLSDVEMRSAVEFMIAKLGHNAKK